MGILEAIARAGVAVKRAPFSELRPSAVRKRETKSFFAEKDEEKDKNALHPFSPGPVPGPGPYR